MPGTIRPLVADMATNLLGRDVLKDLNVVLAAVKEEYLQIKDQKYRDQKNPKSQRSLLNTSLPA